MNKIKKSIILLLIFTLIVGISNISRAENVLNSTAPSVSNPAEEPEDNINDSLEDILSKHGIPNEVNQIIEEASNNDGNYFHASKDSFTLNSDIDGDAFILCGGKLTIDSYITGSAFICANEVEITNNAEISSSLFCVSKDITIYGGINLNAYCASGSFSLKEDSHIFKNLYLSAETISLDGLIERNAFISGDNIEIQPNCSIQGNLDYSAPNEIEIRESAVKGNVRFSSNAVQVTKRTVTDKISDVLKSIISYMVFAVIIFLILNGIKSKIIDTSSFKANIGKYVLFGLLVLFVLPILNLIILFIPVLTRLAFVVLGLYILLLMLASVITVITLSKLCSDKFKDSIKTNDTSRTIIFITLFSIAYKLLKLIPIAGFLLTLVVVVLGIGITIKNLLPSKETDE